MDSFHTPVLLDETIEYLKIRKGEKYIDCTLGGGGHSARIVELGGKVLSIDQDEDAIEYAKKLQINKNNWIIQKGNFANIEEIAKEAGFEKVSGVLFDLGVSSHQFEDESRGFSFNSDAELDMRMDKSLGVKASVLVNGLARRELERLFLELGEEKNAWKIAREIEKVRKFLPIRTCRQLAEICERVNGQSGKLHPATKVFQALRIQINDELGSLRSGLVGSFSVLKKNGRLVVISFHSLEDRIAKNYFKSWANDNKGKNLTDKPISPKGEEIELNARARSAKLRAFEKI